MPLPERFLALLTELESDHPRMPPTLLYNEGWLLRLLLDAAQRGLIPAIPPATNWFSEAQLRTPFGRGCGQLAEANTRADGVMGDFDVDENTKSGLRLRNNAARFDVFEAKMYSPFSNRTTNAPGYDQVARTVACMAYTLQQAHRTPGDFERIKFCVVAPKILIENGVLNAAMNPASIRGRIEERISQFAGQVRDRLNVWSDQWAWPLLDWLAGHENALEMKSWENLISPVEGLSPADAQGLADFYAKCRHHNNTVVRKAQVAGMPARGRIYVKRVGTNAGQTVRVCSVGRINSRVFFPQRSQESFLVCNYDLEEVPDAGHEPPLPDPARNREYWWNANDQELVRVRVVYPGPCNSRVLRVGGPPTSFIVANHQLKPV